MDGAVLYAFAAALVLVVFYVMREPRRFKAKVTRSLEQYLIAVLASSGHGLSSNLPFRMVPGGTLLSKLRIGDAGWMLASSFVSNEGGSRDCVFATGSESTISDWLPSTTVALVYMAPNAKLYVALFTLVGDDAGCWPISTIRSVSHRHYPLMVLPEVPFGVVSFARSLIS